MNPSAPIFRFLAFFAYIFTLSDAHAANIVTEKGGNVHFLCVSFTDPMWLMQSHAQVRLHGIAMGDTENARFDNQRFVLECHSALKVNRCQIFL